MNQETKNYMEEKALVEANETVVEDDIIDAEALKNAELVTDDEEIMPPPNLESIQEKKILDSGERTEFDSGAVRDMHSGKGRCDLLPLNEVINWFRCICTERTNGDASNPIWVKYNDILSYIYTYLETREEENINEAILLFSEAVYTTPFDTVLELAKHYEEGAKKYAERNWEKGIPLHCYIDSGIRHLTKFFRNDQDEPHDRAFLWNMYGLLWTIHNKPECDDLPALYKDTYT